jgi:hypothetical protein
MKGGAKGYLGAENDIGSRLDDLLDALLGNVELTLADAVELLDIVHENLHVSDR